jgi:2-hydroxymuconate-semialdehyde hydrolase
MKQEITIDGLKLNINIEEAGSGDTTILFVHGIPTNARLWRHVQAHLKDRYRTLAMDMVGYGQSDMPLNNFKHTLTNQAEAIKGVIEALDLKGKVILVGHDHGGGACQIFASKYCDYISRLALFDCVSFDYWPVLEVEAFASLDGVEDDAILGPAMGQAAAGFAGLLRTGSHDKIAFTDQNVKQNYLKFWGRGPGFHGFKSMIKICNDPTVDETMNVDHSKITCPTLVCWGKYDAFMPVEAGRRLKKAISGPTRFQIIDQAGHYVPEDRPDVVADYLDDFITEWEGVEISS